MLVCDEKSGHGAQWAAILAHRGYRIVHAHGADDAIARFQRDTSIAVVLADLDRDGGDGIALIEALRAQDGGRAVEYLVAAGSNAPDAAVRAVRLRVLDLLIKPVGDEDLATAVSDAYNVARMKRFQREEARSLEASLADLKMRTHAALSQLIAQAQGAYNIAPATLPGPAAAPEDSELQAFIAEESERARLREKTFGALARSHSVWTLLLALWDSQHAGTELTVKSAAYAAGLPLSSALRKINEMSADGLVTKRGDPEDARRSFVSLTAQGRSYFARFFHEWNENRSAAKRAMGA
jgi:CheY-like chemotaxis protein